MINIHLQSLNIYTCISAIEIIVKYLKRYKNNFENSYLFIIDT